MPPWLEKWRAAAGDLPADELRRRRREAVLIAVTLVAFAVLAALEMQLPDFGDSASQSSNVVFFLLINLNVILLVLLVFLVGRNLVKLIFERRRRILGARLRTRLVLAFASLSLIPTVLLFVIAQGFMSSTIDNWFSVRVRNGLTGSLEVAHSYYQEAGDDALHYAGGIGREVQARGLLREERRSELERFIAEKRAELNVDGIDVLVGRESVAAVRDPKLGQRGLHVLAGDLETALSEGMEFARTQKVGRGDLVRGGVPIRAPDGAVVGVVVVDTLVQRAVSNAARRAARSYQEYNQLRVLKQPIVNSYTLTFLLITLAVLFSATWFAFYFAKGFTGPIQRLGEGMREVAQGNWDYRAEAGGDEEIATLVTSFNQMAAELKTIHSALEERHRYIGSILTNITAGVVSVDESGAVATVNPAAGSMLKVDPEHVLGLHWREAFSRADLHPVVGLLTRINANPDERMERQVKLQGGRRALTAWVTATALTDENGVSRGFILFFEDVSYLLRVERMEAWREVARRIAHEIKNPLTPIQLSAQRLRRRYGDKVGPEEKTLFDEATRTIIDQVEQIKRLVNEFSTFARLPAVEVAPQRLSDLAEEALVLFREGHREIAFDMAVEPEVPLVVIDREAVKRAVINLLDNAVAACQGTSGARVEVVIAHDTRMKVVRLEVADNGRGMTADVKVRAFEPYFSTKKDGTGLGLAIVSAMVADHQAYVRVRDNPPRGTRVVIEFPLRKSAPLRASARA